MRRGQVYTREVSIWFKTISPWGILAMYRDQEKSLGDRSDVQAKHRTMPHENKDKN